MFTVAERVALRDRIIERAERDTQITACALIGSAARGEEDDWSDIDIALRLADDSPLDVLATQWSEWLTSAFAVADTLDVYSGGALYRVFLLENSMQVDLSFWPHHEFRSTGGPMRLVFGEAAPIDEPIRPDAREVGRMGWLYALHARSAVARGRALQADMMLTELRNQVIALACLREDHNPSQGRGAHLLPAQILDELAAARASDLTNEEQTRSLHDTLHCYRAELDKHDALLTESLDTALAALRLD